MDILFVVMAACMVAAVALCGIPFGLIISERMAGVDVREHGSGNIGMTNVARSVGGAAAALTFACDVGKGLVSMLIAKAALGAVMPAEVEVNPSAPAFAAFTVVYACCVLGHVFSPYLGFHGGKGISVGFGAALGLFWPVALVLLAVFLLATLPTRYISAGSICAAVTIPLQCLFLWHMTPWATVPIVVAAASVLWAHRENMRKLIRGEERRFEIREFAVARERRRKVAPTARKEGEE